ncbi:hypothetical protein BX286_4951 [Streptomyces sp. 3211.6]|uniref:hypothetical protein n=1 Tax=Streptomyces sp. 3211.6 TaxID=1938845 RepID=UPI000EB51132|nr:hypothetical protein [Streptomyces sp. 3211.6]RKT06904.1 hypothetical protein BX286_4951 [Streptomyces sp. 3211.6]
MAQQPFWSRRLFVFAASTVVAAGSALLNVAAFAAVHGTPQLSAAGQQWECYTAPCNPPDGDGHGKGGPPVNVPSGHDWQCFTAPCGPPGGSGAGEGGKPPHVPSHQWECFVAPCNPPADGSPLPHPEPEGTPAGPGVQA